MSNGEAAFIGYQLSICRAASESEVRGWWDRVDLGSREAWESGAEAAIKNAINTPPNL
jgi:hypothetical protein